MPLRLFLDTEFTDLSAEAVLISAACVTDIRALRAAYRRAEVSP